MIHPVCTAQKLLFYSLIPLISLLFLTCKKDKENEIIIPCWTTYYTEEGRNSIYQFEIDDSGHGWALAADPYRAAVNSFDYLYVTDDFGTTWTKAELPERAINKYDWSGINIHIVDASQVIIYSGNTFITMDGGQTWTESPHDGSDTYRHDGIVFNPDYYTGQFFDANNGYRSGRETFGTQEFFPDTRVAFSVTADGGATWTRRDPAIPGLSNRVYLTDSYFINQNTGWPIWACL